jgi:hypothetical protein
VASGVLELRRVLCCFSNVSTLCNDSPLSMRGSFLLLSLVIRHRSRSYCMLIASVTGMTEHTSLRSSERVLTKRTVFSVVLPLSLFSHVHGHHEPQALKKYLDMLLLIQHRSTPTCVLLCATELRPRKLLAHTRGAFICERKVRSFIHLLLFTLQIRVHVCAYMCVELS